MKVLVLTHHRIPNNFNGAVTRIRNLSEQLARLGAKLSIRAYLSPRLVTQAPRNLVPGCYYSESTNLFQWWDGIGSRLGLPPYSLTTFLNRFLPLTCLEKESYDVVISESPFLWKIARRLKGQIKILSAHNYETAYHDNFSPLALTLLRNNETQAIHEADAVVAVTQEDKQVFRKMNPHVPIYVIPNGVRCSRPSSAADSCSKKLLKSRWQISDHHRVALFLASNSLHNQRGLQALGELFSKAELQSRWTLVVVGDIQSGMSLPNNVIACGPQSDLIPFLAGSDLALNPVVSGSGSNVKLIEYLGHGLPVLTTSFGLRGYDHHLRGIHVEPLERFEHRLISETQWASPDPKELIPYEWASLGKSLFQTLQNLVHSRKIIE